VLEEMMNSKLISAILDPKIHNPFDHHSHLVCFRLLSWLHENVKGDASFWHDVGVDCAHIVEGIMGMKRGFNGKLKDYIIYIGGHKIMQV
jgi:hypothetical protein